MDRYTHIRLLERYCQYLSCNQRTLSMWLSLDLYDRFCMGNILSTNATTILAACFSVITKLLYNISWDIGIFNTISPEISSKWQITHAENSIYCKTNYITVRPESQYLVKDHYILLEFVLPFINLYTCNYTQLLDAIIILKKNYKKKDIIIPILETNVYVAFVYNCYHHYQKMYPKKQQIKIPNYGSYEDNYPKTSVLKFHYTPLKIWKLADLNKAKNKKFIGEGTFGKVYHIDVDNNSYALKKIDNEEHGLSGLLLREICLMHLVRHPRIVAIEGVCQLDFSSSTYIIMEKMDTNLYKLLRYRQIDEEFKIPLIRQIIEGVIHIHSLGVIHRDLNVGNILISGDTVKIADFGSACLNIMDGSHKYSTDVCASFFRPIELYLRCQYYDKSMDIWSLAMVIIAVLTGRYYLSKHEDDQIIEEIFRLLGEPTREDIAEWNFMGLQKKSVTKIIQKSLLDTPKKQGIAVGLLNDNYSEFKPLILEMLAYNPKKRPNAETVLIEFDKILKY
jgi:predicted Ser/Thr protein kinase